MVAFLATRAGDGVISEITAGWAHELMPASPLPYVIVRSGASPRARVARIRRGTVPAADRVRKWGMAVTSVSRTIVDLAPLVERSVLESIVDTAFCRKLATAASVEASIQRLPRAPASASVVRAATSLWTPDIEPGSVAEVRLLRHLEELGVVGLVTQFEVYDADGRFVAKLDVAVPEVRAAFEYDGVEAHNPRRWARDESRYARLKALGWSVESVSKLDLLPGEPRIREIVSRWLAAGAA